MGLKQEKGVLLRPGTSCKLVPQKILWQRQRGGRWCWAACASMTLRALGSPTRQCKVAKKALKGDCAIMPCSTIDEALPSCDVGYPAMYIKALWQDFQIQATLIPTFICWSTLLAELENGPVEILLGRSDKKESGHLVLLIDACEDSAGIRIVLVADPASDRNDVSPKRFEDVRTGLGWGEWSLTWTGLRFSQEEL